MFLRAPGRPRIVHTGQRGRFRKLRRTRDIPGVSTEIIEQREEETNEKSEETDQEFVQAISNMAEIKVEDAMSGNFWPEWKKAIKAEVRSLLKNNTFDIVDRPTYKQLVGCRTVLINKVNAGGTLSKRKARIVAMGYSQRPRIDFVETFSPVARLLH